MSEAKSYKKQEVSEDYVAEPMAMEYSTVAEDAGYLNDDILVDAIKYTQTVREKGQMIPNGEVYGLLAGRMGWKYFLRRAEIDSKSIQERLKNIQERVVSSLPKRSLIRPFHVVIATIFSEHSFQFGQPPIFRHRIKARAFLHRIQVMMPHYQNFRKNPFQFAQQCH